MDFLPRGRLAVSQLPEEVLCSKSRTTKSVLKCVHVAMYIHIQVERFANMHTHIHTRTCTHLQSIHTPIPIKILNHSLDYEC